MNKRTLIKYLVCCLCLTMASCGGGDDGGMSTGTGTTTGTGTSMTTGTSTGTGTTTGTGGSTTTDGDTPIALSLESRPADWVRVGTTADYLPGVSVSFVIAQPVFTKYSTPSIAEDREGDMIALFVNGTCRGVSALMEGNVFMPTAVSLDKTDNPNTNKLVTIRYYSAKLHHVFTAKATYYMKNSDEIYGTRTAPLKLDWLPE